MADYAVESISSVCQIIFYFVAKDDLLLMSIFLTITLSIWSVPIPLSYLINESRVKDIIIQDGWIEGLRSVFYSCEKIRTLERQKLQNCRRDANKLERQNDNKPSIPQPPLIITQRGREEENHVVEKSEHRQVFEQERGIAECSSSDTSAQHAVSNLLKTNVHNLDLSYSTSTDETIVPDNNRRKVRTVPDHGRSITHQQKKNQTQTMINKSVKQNEMVVVDIEVETNDTSSCGKNGEIENVDEEGRTQDKVVEEK